MKPENILEIKDLKVKFPVTGGLFLRKIADIKAVDGINLEIAKGDTLGLVGESGCGKSTVAKAIIKVLKFAAPNVSVEGEIWLRTDDGEVNLLKLKAKEMRKYRGYVQIIFHLRLENLFDCPLILHRNFHNRLRHFYLLQHYPSPQPSHHPQG